MADPSSDLSVADHLRLAQEHLAHADWLRALPEPSATQLGWAFTAAYYAALHTASGYVLARHGVRAHTHVERDRWFRGGYPEFSRIDRTDYLDLKRFSEGVRYLGWTITVMRFDALRARAGQFVTKFATRASSGTA